MCHYVTGYYENTLCSKEWHKKHAVPQISSLPRGQGAADTAFAGIQVLWGVIDLQEWS